MDKRIIIGLFSILCIWQWYLVIGQISSAEKVRHQGNYLKIPCRQVDPIDPFRGTYLMINPEPAFIEFIDSGQYEANQSIFINYSCDQDGLCTYLNASTEAQTNYSIKCKVAFVTPIYKDVNKTGYQAIIEYPFAKYFINEKSAPRITTKYNEAIVDTTRQVYAGVFVHNGNAILDALWVNDQKLE